MSRKTRSYEGSFGNPLLHFTEETHIISKYYSR